jgi:integrase
MDDSEVERYLDHLVLQQKVAAKTQATALNALAFLYKHIIQQELSLSLNFVRSSKQAKLPVVITASEVQMLLPKLSTKYYLICSLLYGSGLRSMEAVQLRVQGIDFDYKSIRVWNGKGNKHRIVTLAGEIIPLLRNQIMKADEYLQFDLMNEMYAGVLMPNALAKKYPSYKLSAAPETGEIRQKIKATHFQLESRLLFGISVGCYFCLSFGFKLTVFYSLIDLAVVLVVDYY